MRRAVLAFVAVVTLAGCAPDAKPPAPTPTPPAEVATAYEAYWTAWTAAQETGDPDDLAAVTADPLLTSLHQALREQAERDEITRGPITRTPLGAEQRGSGWAIATCADFDAQRDYGPDGTEVDGQLTDKPSTVVTVVLRPREGGWRAVGLYYEGGCG